MESGTHVVGLVGAAVGLLLVAAGTHVVAQRLRLPFTVLLVITGILIAWLAELPGGSLLRHLSEWRISPEVILFVFLPTLIFESAFNLDARQLRRNLSAILTLAVPGLVVSTAIIGALFWLGTGQGVPLAVALVLGSVMSATDPVAVVALFRQLGAPKRLTVLVEGESLFNDATAIVLSGILLSVALAGSVSGDVVLGGLARFIFVFAGGIVVGLAMAFVTGLILARLENEPLIEISLTTILAYFSFLVAEHFLHVSGVMACVAAGVTMGGWGRSKISPPVEDYLEHFWEYMAFVCNALIFLLVGMRVDFGALAERPDWLLYLIGAMLLSRAIVIFGLVPLVGRLPRTDAISRPYQAVMYWGGLRGAIALAIVLSPAFADMEHIDTIIALVSGAVLFTLLVQGLSMERLVRGLGLDRAPLSDRLARAEGGIAAKQRAMERLPTLQAGGMFSARIAAKVQNDCQTSIDTLRDTLTELRRKELDEDHEVRLVFAQALATEKSLYHQLHREGHLTEKAFRELLYYVDVQNERLTHVGRHPGEEHHLRGVRRLERFLRSLLRLPGLGALGRWFHLTTVAGEYELSWGRHQSALRALEFLDDVDREGSASAAVVARVRTTVEDWAESSKARLDEMAEKHPEFVTDMQERLAQRLVLLAEKQEVEANIRSGAIPQGVGESMLTEIGSAILRLRGRSAGKLEFDPMKLLRAVPFLSSVPQAEFDSVVEALKERSVPADEHVITQGEVGDSLFIIGHGVVRVSLRQEDGSERDLATLLAGDVFGEMALLSKEPRTATCRTVSPCTLYELTRADFENVVAHCPSLHAAVEKVDRERRAELDDRDN